MRRNKNYKSMAGKKWCVRGGGQRAAGITNNE